MSKSIQFWVIAMRGYTDLYLVDETKDDLLIYSPSLSVAKRFNSKIDAALECASGERVVRIEMIPGTKHPRTAA